MYVYVVLVRRGGCLSTPHYVSCHTCLGHQRLAEGIVAGHRPAHPRPVACGAGGGIEQGGHGEVVLVLRQGNAREEHLPCTVGGLRVCGVDGVWLSWMSKPMCRSDF